MATDIRERLGQEIRRQRIERGWKQIDLAAESNMSTNHVSGVERGQREICIDSLERLAKALDLKPSDLLKSAGS